MTDQNEQNQKSECCGGKCGDHHDHEHQCGCGAKLDIRDFGPQGKIDRNFYYIDVPEKDYEKARTLLMEAGFSAQ